MKNNYVDSEELRKKSRERYIKSIIEEAKNKSLILYGAGAIGKGIYAELKQNGQDILCFCVTDKRKNRKEICDVPVLQLDEIGKKKESAVFILAVKNHNRDAVISALQKFGATDYITVPDHVLDFVSNNFKRTFGPSVEITTRIGCSINCRFCPQDLLVRNYHKESGRAGLLTLESFKKCLEHMPAETILSFSGFCEPFLNPECIDMIENAVESGHEVTLNTTLVGMSMENAKRLSKLQLGMVVLHTPDVDHFANIPVTEEYLRVLDYLLDAKKRNGAPFLDHANCQSSPDQKLLQFINNRISFSELELIDRAGNLKDETVYRGTLAKGEIVCEKSMKLNRNVLLPDGSVVLCCMDFGLRHVLGNLIDQTYEEIMNGTEMEKIKECMQNGCDVLCRHCNVARRIEKETGEEQL